MSGAQGKWRWWNKDDKKKDEICTRQGEGREILF
jgi:hypothetical protein